MTRGAPCARPALLTPEPALPPSGSHAVPSLALTQPRGEPSWETRLHPAQQKPEWLGREEFAPFQGVTTYPGLKSSWNRRVSASQRSLRKAGASLVCPSSSWLKGNCAAAGNSIKPVSKHFFHPQLMLNTPLLRRVVLPKPCQHCSRTKARLKSGVV